MDLPSFYSDKFKPHRPERIKLYALNSTLFLTQESFKLWCWTTNERNWVFPTFFFQEKNAFRQSFTHNGYQGQPQIWFQEHLYLPFLIPVPLTYDPGGLKLEECKGMTEIEQLSIGIGNLYLLLYFGESFSSRSSVMRTSKGIIFIKGCL